MIKVIQSLFMTLQGSKWVWNGVRWFSFSYWSASYLLLGMTGWFPSTYWPHSTLCFLIWTSVPNVEMLDYIWYHSWRLTVILKSPVTFNFLWSRWFALWLRVEKAILCILWLYFYQMLSTVWVISRKVWRACRVQPATATCGEKFESFD